MDYSLEDKYRLIKENLLKAKSTNPVSIAEGIMKKDFISMHGPEHHFLDGGSFLTAYKNAGGQIDLSKSLDELALRSQKMPGAMCGYWGVCGASASLGASLAVINKTGPLSNDDYYKANMELTSRILTKMSLIGGPRCCKRNAFIALKTATGLVREKYGINMEEDVKTVCSFSPLNKTCLKEKCPFNPAYKDKKQKAYDYRFI